MEGYFCKCAKRFVKLNIDFASDYTNLYAWFYAKSNNKEIDEY